MPRSHPRRPRDIGRRRRHDQNMAPDARLCAYDERARLRRQCVAVLPAGGFVTGSSDYTLKHWGADLAAVRTLSGHTAGVWCVSVLSGGRVVSGTGRPTGGKVRVAELKVWDTATGNCLQTLYGHSGRIFCVVALPGNRIVSGADDCVRPDTLKVWDLAEGRCVQTLEGHRPRSGRWPPPKGNITCMCLLPDGRLITGAADATIKVWGVFATDDAADDASYSSASHLSDPFAEDDDSSDSPEDDDVGFPLRCRRTLRGRPVDEGGINCVACLADGRIVSGAESSLDGASLVVWDPNDGSALQRFSKQCTVCCVTALEDGRFVTGDDEGSIQVWSDRVRSREKRMAAIVVRRRACDVNKRGGRGREKDVK